MDKKEAEMDKAADDAEEAKSKQEEIEKLEAKVKQASETYDNFVKSIEEGLKNLPQLLGYGN